MKGVMAHKIIIFRQKTFRKKYTTGVFTDDTNS